jgi:hypothetical protein
VRERSFTVEQANTHVPRLRLLVERLQRGALELRRARDRAASAPDAAAVPVERLLASHPELRRLAEGLDAIIEEIRRLGVELKDLELGLVDFPGERDGEAIYWCWQYGEDRIRYWHRRSEGFAARRALPGLPPPPDPQ